MKFSEEVSTPSTEGGIHVFVKATIDGSLEQLIKLHSHNVWTYVAKNPSISLGDVSRESRSSSSWAAVSKVVKQVLTKQMIWLSC